MLTEHGEWSWKVILNMTQSFKFGTDKEMLTAEEWQYL
jgi:hypothetical protein